MDKVSLAANGDSLELQEAAGLLSLDFEGWYYIGIEGTLGASTTVTPWIRPKGMNVWDKLENPKNTDDIVFNATSRRIYLVPGNCEVKFVVANYSGSSNVVARRIRAAKGA